MVIHFVLTLSGYYIFNYTEERLKSYILRKMEKYKIKKIMVTVIWLRRSHLITKEKMENYCKGNENRKKSANDDLESLFDDIRIGKKPDERVETYFLPKLTNQQLELVESKDQNFMNTFSSGLGADVSEVEMKASESDSKFVDAYGYRRTFIIENSEPEKIPEDSIENQPPLKKMK